MNLIESTLIGREGDYEIWEESCHTEHGTQKYTIAVLAPEVRKRYVEEGFEKSTGHAFEKYTVVMDNNKIDKEH